MDDVVARCPDCGNEQLEAFAHCFVCMKPSRWWCRACYDWRPTRNCPACGGGLGVPAELSLGTGVIGTALAFTAVARNPGKKPIGCTVSSPDVDVSIDGVRLLVAPGGAAEVSGHVALSPGPLGPRTFHLHFAAPIPSETVLHVEAVAPAPRLEFLPPVVFLRSPNPGSILRTSIVLKNTGNVPLSATVSATEPWLAAEPKAVTLAPNESAELRLRARSKKTDSGLREATLTASAEGESWEATLRYTLPDPELAADSIEFGELKPGLATHADLIVRNTGRVRVACTITPAQPWLRVVPARINLPVGGQKKIRVRATLTADHDGPQRSEILIAHPTGVLLCVPVTATGKIPKPLLRAVRKQRIRDAAGTAIERKFQLANDGEGRLDVSATADQPWVRIVTTELQVGPGKKRKLRYIIDFPSLSRGEHSATITLATNAGTVAVPVTVHVLEPNPLLEVLDAPALETVSPELPLTAFVRVRNAGIGLLRVRAECEDPRLTVTPTEADVPAGPPVRFTLTIPIDGLPGGEHQAAVRLTSNGGDGRAAIRFRLPVEMIDAPSMIDLGDRPAGRLTGDTLRIKNVGPDRVSLRVQGEHQWLRPGAERIALAPGETIAIPFRLDLPPDVFGPVMSAIRLEGRSVRHTVAVRAVARKVDLIVVPGVLILGDMIPGEERAFTVDVVNAGEITAEVRASHTAGELEVWVRRATLPPGERVTLAGRVRVNATQHGRQVRTLVPLAPEAAVRFVAQVVPPLLPKVLAGLAAAGGLIAGGALWVAVGWWLGLPLALFGVVVGAWLFWRQMT